MLANKHFLIAVLPALMAACAAPAISKGGSKVKVVRASNCKFIGNIMSISRDGKTGNLNYEASHKQIEEYQSNLAREKAFEMGANQIVRAYSFRDPHVEDLIAFYSAHRCSK